MSLLATFLRGLASQPPESLAATQGHGDLDQALDRLYQVAVLEYRQRCARELRELLADPSYAAPGRLERHGRKVWSQSDEDGIIEEIFRRIGTTSRTFVEFGVSDGRQCNTLKLLVEGWRGLWMESSAEDCARIRQVFAPQLGDGRLELLQANVTAETVDRLIGSARVAASGGLDLLSIDIDGNDYHVLKAMQAVQPRVLVVEYNGKFPPPMDLVQPYDPAHVWDRSDYFGASLQAIANLAARRGYRLVGTNVVGVNAFFVRSDLAADHFAEGGAAALYNPPRYWMTPGFAPGHSPGHRFDYLSDAAIARQPYQE
jgi:hypothetical protein